MASPGRRRSVFGILSGSPLARYTFLLFTFAALVPVLYIAYLSYERVSRQLIDQNLEQSRQLSKSLGMEIFRRIDNASTRLARVTSDWQGDTTIAAADLADFASVTIGRAGGSAHVLKGEMLKLPPLDEGQLKTLSTEGHALVLAASAAAGHPTESDAILALVHRPTSDGEVSAIATLRRPMLASLKEIMPPGSELVLLGPRLEILYRSTPWMTEVKPSLRSALQQGVSGHFPWTAVAGGQLAAYWTLFTRPEFGLDRIVVLASADEGAALVPISQFRSTYLPVLVLLILGVALVTARQLRIRLEPLIELRDATRSISEGQFRVRMDVDSGDEIGELATAFNEMSTKLDHQFSNLEAMAEIDRQILSSFDTRQIVETVVQRAGELAPCTWVAMLEISTDDERIGLLTAHSMHSAETVTKQSVTLAVREREDMLSARELVLDPSVQSRPAYLHTLPSGTFPFDTPVLLLPIIIEEELAATLLFAFSDDEPPALEFVAQLRKFADHVTVAFANARWQARLFDQAHFDALTGLPNRTLMLDRLAQAMGRSDRSNTRVALLFIDLDEFKVVNDSLGHAAGDKLLKWCAERLSASVRSQDTVARFGGDEFLVIVSDIAHPNGATLEGISVVAQSILDALARGTVIEGVKIDTGGSLGIALYPDDAATAEDLMARADAAMYSAKGAGRNCYRFYEPEMNQAAIRRLGFKQELRRGISGGELRLFYQPQHDCDSGSLVGAEALVRWQHPRRGLVPPGEFIELAEQMGCINELGEWVLNTACSDLAAWTRAGLGNLKIAVNISPKQFRGQDLAEVVRRYIGEHRIDANQIELEITESAIMDRPEESIRSLARLRALGVSLAIDDFGTGYSSLGYLKDLWIDKLKIDQSFIRVLLDDARSNSIVCTVIKLAHDLDLRVVAEGVECEEQRAILRELGCDICQGYLFNRPLSASGFVKLLQDQPARRRARLA